MINKNIIFQNFIPKDLLNKKTEKKLKNDFESIRKNILNNLKNEKSFYSLFSDKFKLNFKIKDLDKFKKFKTIAIFGMGGSILGSEAIYQYLRNKIKKKIYFFDNIDNEKILSFKKNNRLIDTLFIIISKSGNTVETLSNIFSLNIINQKFRKNIIVICEKNNNLLYSFVKEEEFFHIEHKKFIGGRYSVLSEVGLLPAYLMGLNIFDIRKNPKKYLFNKELVFLKDSSIKLANILLSKNLSNLVFLNYSTRLDKFLFWSQQLIAESLGKKGKGFFPVISNAPKDHHSLLQLYLDGPKDKIFYIFSIKENQIKKIKSKKLRKKKKFINNKKLNDIKKAQLISVKKILIKNNIPFREIEIQNNDPKTLGELLSYFILETILVGHLVGINHFNQPAVEQEKIQTKKELSK